MGEQTQGSDDFFKQNPANSADAKPELLGKTRRQKSLPTLEEDRVEVEELLRNAEEADYRIWESKNELLIVGIEICPQCELEELNIYKTEGEGFRCLCRNCRAHGKGETSTKALEATCLNSHP